MSRQRSNSGVGASSILLIIVVLSLTTFGVLTLVSARADKTLSDRATETTKAYYVADAAAQARLMEIDEALLAGASPADIPFLSAIDGAEHAYAFTCETGDGRAIQAIVTVPTGESRCTPTAYKLIQTTDWQNPGASFQLADPAQ